MRETRRIPRPALLEGVTGDGVPLLRPDLVPYVHIYICLPNGRVERLDDVLTPYTNVVFYVDPGALPKIRAGYDSLVVSFERAVQYGCAVSIGVVMCDNA